jgi:hypothetical protein
VKISKQKGKGKRRGKVVPVQAWTVPEVSRKFRLPDLKTGLDRS